MSDYYRLGTIIDTLQITFHLMFLFPEKQVFKPMFLRIWGSEFVVAQATLVLWMTAWVRTPCLVTSTPVLSSLQHG